MPYCTNCGAYYDEGAKFCPTCGIPAEENGQQSEAQQNAGSSYHAQPAQDCNSKNVAILAVVFPVLFFLPLVTTPKTRFGTFWANQALLLFLLSIVGSITSRIFIGFGVWVFELVLWIMALVSVCKGEMKRLPLIGTIDIIK